MGKPRQTRAYRGEITTVVAALAGAAILTVLIMGFTVALAGVPFVGSDSAAAEPSAIQANETPTATEEPSTDEPPTDTPTDEPPTDTATATQTETQTETPDNGTESLTKLSPTENLTVAPGQGVFFQVESDDFAEWYVDDTPGVADTPYESAIGGFVFSESDPGTYNVTAEADGQTAEWEISVADDGLQGPTSERVNPTNESLCGEEGDSFELTASAEAGDGALNRVIWFVSMSDHVETETSVSGQSDEATADVEYVGGGAAYAIVVDAHGLISPMVSPEEDTAVWGFDEECEPEPPGEPPESVFERHSPDDGITVAPGTIVSFEAEVAEEHLDDVLNGEYTVNGNSYDRHITPEVPYHYGDHQERLVIWHAFSDEGEYELEVSHDDGDVADTISWTVYVEEGGMEPPSIDAIASDPDPIPAEAEDVELTVTASSEHAEIERIWWWEAVYEGPIGETTTSGSEVTETITPDYEWIDDSYIFPIAIDSEGLVAISDMGWTPNGGDDGDDGDDPISFETPDEDDQLTQYEWHVALYEIIDAHANVTDPSLEREGDETTLDYVLDVDVDEDTEVLADHRAYVSGAFARTVAGGSTAETLAVLVFDEDEQIIEEYHVEAEDALAWTDGEIEHAEFMDRVNGTVED